MDSSSSDDGFDCDTGKIQIDSWEDWQGEDKEEQSCRSLFEARAFPTPEQAFEFDEEKYGFDLRKYVRRHGLSEYQAIKCVNYIRDGLSRGAEVSTLLSALESAGNNPEKCPFKDDKWLTPVLEDDGLLFYDFEDIAAEGSCRGEEPAAGANVSVRELIEENQKLRDAFAELKWSILPEELHEEGKENGDPPTVERPPVPRRAPISPENLRVDRSYFEGYGYFDIHREMLSDKHRTETYREALELNPSTVAGKRVLDVGCGTGILSMFAARGGASAVVGVDGSARIAGFAQRIVEANGLGPRAGGCVHIVPGKVEDLPALPAGVEQVDVIVSEWMGYALLFESMLDSVLAARDRWLRPGGAMLPDRAVLLAAPGGPGSTGLGFWEDVYGFSMTAIAEEEHQSALRTGIVRVVSPSDLLGEAAALKDWDLLSAAPSDLDFTSEFRLPLDSEAAGAQSRLCASVVLWFETPFSERACPEHPVVLSTSPHRPATHWAQTVLPLREPIDCQKATAVVGRLSFASRPGSCRSLDISLECWAELDGGERFCSQAAVYSMGVQQDGE
uniref:type I protein arginine methyltransferase n=1 Tax=Tetraselmis sp. GSL018 TaxID=582737 RepID=A0A061SNI7_9CHLO|mmetsp:Transcript_12789/g.30323  ORF Transcript_12789/g.30323 Transcript_12789/m.30323 type:complete len:560 (-) Transcript_12789:338-2017(-)